MKTKYFEIKINYFMLVVMTGVVVWCCLNYFTLYFIPKGELQQIHTSPNGEYTVNIYLCNGGATTHFAIRGELISGNKRKNIYWQYRQSSAAVKWIDDTHVKINHVTLDITKDIYDNRHIK